MSNHLSEYTREKEREQINEELQSIGSFVIFDSTQERIGNLQARLQEIQKQETNEKRDLERLTGEGVTEIHRHKEITIYRANDQLYIKGTKTYSFNGFPKSANGLEPSTLALTTEGILIEKQDSIFAGSVSEEEGKPFLYIFDLGAGSSKFGERESYKIAEQAAKYFAGILKGSPLEEDVMRPQSLINFLYSFSKSHEGELPISSASLTVLVVNQDDKNIFFFADADSVMRTTIFKIDCNGQIEISKQNDRYSAIEINFRLTRPVTFQFASLSSEETVRTKSVPYDSQLKYFGHFDIRSNQTQGESNYRVFVLKALINDDLYPFYRALKDS